MFDCRLMMLLCSVPTATLALAIVFGLLALAFVIAAAVMLYRRRSKRRARYDMSSEFNTTTIALDARHSRRTATDLDAPTSRPAPIAETIVPLDNEAVPRPIVAVTVQSMPHLPGTIALQDLPSFLDDAEA